MQSLPQLPRALQGCTPGSGLLLPWMGRGPAGSSGVNSQRSPEESKQSNQDAGL